MELLGVIMQMHRCKTYSLRACDKFNYFINNTKKRFLRHVVSDVLWVLKSVIHLHPLKAR